MKSPQTVGFRLWSILRSVRWLSVALFLSALLPFWLLAGVMDDGSVYAVAGFGLIMACYVGWSYYVVMYRPWYRDVFGVGALVVVLCGYAIGVVTIGWVYPTPIQFVHLFAIALIFVYYWFIALIALYHDQVDHAKFTPSPPFPSITVLVPAYNEAGYVGRTVASLLEARYPEEQLEIIVIDDGSTDETAEEARSFESDGVRVVTKENGGKYSALNYGLLFAEGEVIVTADADSIVATDALKQIVAPFASNPEIGAVASNVTIWNRNSLITRCQQLEYTIGVNIYRRMLDYFGIVLIVPGCLGAYRREAIEGVFAYDPETLTEDFDVTMKILRSGYRVSVSDARVYTEAPDTWTSLYNQRLRWYRGNYMTLFKHIRVVVDSSYGLLHRLAVPFRLVELFFLPVATWIILGFIAWLLLVGQVVQVLALFVFFTSIIVLIAALGILIEGEDWRLIIYAPLFVIGYKHFHDALNLKCLFDVVSDRDLDWTHAQRIDQREADDSATE
ncbi:Glycosyltransferase, catalytic subunit of cellulose synthase and poly-beta-1,6-N-acetylglucosamine synthase [Natronorubrum sediminis]|uniref:Glycosyltransferase, catalytic subunit of cellulose synthase and poly-beta-1,6-N-acetylglucosamine synthase n=1 Tax=Natronorubrum sediminis TaxID=640943 RepID=A0A1H6G0K3_9EURY|nr:glycosyltransferase [Natronorubrum sediminis]SEH16617.1 Glycosyltransferase, catalytic subunit of cellulose synthase and poly-beta-1,6-N-acetylglucosamine synthase [Natronorubrum sediminis]